MPEIGETLRDARMRARIDVSEIEAKTKIRAKYLRALENEEWGLLPGPTFVKSFLRTYAQALGLDGKALVEEYRLQPGEPERRGCSSRSSRARSAAGARVRAAAGASRGRAVDADICAIVVRRRAADRAARRRPRARKAAARLPIRMQPATQQNHRRRHRKRTKPNTATVRLRARARTRSSPSRCTRPAPVYVCLIGDNGRKLIAGQELQAGQSTATYHAKRFEITLGNNAVTLYIDGRARTVPASTQAIGYSITKARGRRRSPSAAADVQISCRLNAGKIFFFFFFFFFIFSDDLNERPRRDRRHRHRGAVRPRQRPQRSLAVRAAARARSGPRAHHDRRRPAGGHARGARVPGRRAARPGRHQRWPRPDRGRSHRRRRRRASRREMVLDEALSERIAEIVAPLMKRWPNIDPEAVAAANRKQATVPRGASVLEPVGTAPGLVVAPARGRAVRRSSCCRGRRGSCSRCGAARSTPTAMASALAGRDRVPPGDDAAVRDPRVGDRRDAARCRARWRRPRPAGGHDLPETRRDRDRHALRARRRPSTVRSSTDPTATPTRSSPPTAAPSTIRSPRCCGARPTRRRRPAESCTGGLLAARLTDRPGSSAYFRGAFVVYSNEVKVTQAGVPKELIEGHGAVSCEVAERLRPGRGSELGADVGVGITGVAGPGGGTEEKPVGLVWLSVDIDGSGPHALGNLPGAAWTSATARVRSRCTCCSARSLAANSPLRLLLRLLLLLRLTTRIQARCCSDRPASSHLRTASAASRLRSSAASRLRSRMHCYRRHVPASCIFAARFAEFTAGLGRRESGHRRFSSRPVRRR